MSLTTKGTPARGLFGATLGFFIGFAAVALFGTTAQKFKDAMALTPAAVGLLVAIPSLTGSLLRIPFAAWVDISGGRKPLLTLLILSIVGMAGLTWVVYTLYYPGGLTPGLYPLILLLGALSGCGIATFSVGISQTSYWSPKARQGAALGIYGGVGNLAPGIFTLILPLVLGTVGLPGAYLSWLVLLVAGTILYYFVGLNAPYFQLLQQGLKPDEARKVSQAQGQEMFPTGKIKDSLLLSTKIWQTWVLAIMYFTTFGGFLAMTSWLPTYWKSFFAVEAVMAGGLTAAYSILSSLVRVVGGRLADQIGGEKGTLLGLAVMLLGAGAMTAAHVLPLAVVAVIVMGIGMGMGNASIFKLVPQNIPQAVGGASGWVGGLGAFGGFVIPPLLGEIARQQGNAGYATGFVVFVGLAILSIALAFLLRQKSSAD